LSWSISRKCHLFLSRIYDNPKM